MSKPMNAFLALIHPMNISTRLLQISTTYRMTGMWLACSLITAPAQAQGSSATDTCLLEALKQAAAYQTVADVLRQCTSLQSEPTPSAVKTEIDEPKRAQAKAGSSSASSKERSPFNDRLQSELRALNEPFALLPHRPNYLLPISHHKRSNPASAINSNAYDANEAQFQMSFKIPLTEPLLKGQIIPFFAYTGRAWWQVYDGERSRPFREYNHEPEFFAALPISGVQALGWNVRMASIGFNHQSNGRSAPESRSWNRIVGEVYADHGTSMWSSLKVWKRLPEKAKLNPTDSNGDDNPAISRYMGNFEFKLGWLQPQSHQLTLTTRKSLQSGGKGALQLDWSHPIKTTPSLRWYVQGFSGYGDSLIDYNQKIQRLGLGIMINDWF
jgi:phospholipase A1/A2